MSARFEYRLRAVRVFTLDFDRALDFYTNRLGLAAASVNADDGVALFETGDATLLLEAMDPADDEARQLVGRFVGASLAVANLEEAYAALHASGVRFVHPPRAQSWGGSMTHFQDPDGNVLTLIQWDAG